MNRPIHIELRSPNAAQSQAFWSSVFGWTFSRQPGPIENWGVATGADDDPGIHGGLVQPRDAQPRTVPWIEVADVDACAAHVEAAGGQLTVPRMAVPGVGDLAYCESPDGILFAIVKCTIGK